MAWFDPSPSFPSATTPDYGTPATFSITGNSQEVIPAGTSSRYISFSNAADSSSIYVNYGAAVDVGTGTYMYKIPASLQHNKFEIPAQSVHMATAEAGLTASIIIAVSEEGS